MSAFGALIAESVSKDNPLEGFDLRVRKISRGDVGDVNAGQPLTWTFIEFEVDEQVVSELAEALSRSIDASGGWYCDFHTGDETFVVFAGRVFRYERAGPKVEQRLRRMVEPSAFLRPSSTGRSST